jgi:hypothetical protein
MSAKMWPSVLPDAAYISRRITESGNTLSRDVVAARGGDVVAARGGDVVAALAS